MRAPVAICSCGVSLLWNLVFDDNCLVFYFFLSFFFFFFFPIFHKQVKIWSVEISIACDSPLLCHEGLCSHSKWHKISVACYSLLLCYEGLCSHCRWHWRCQEDDHLSERRCGSGPRLWWEQTAVSSPTVLEFLFLLPSQASWKSSFVPEFAIFATVLCQWNCTFFFFFFFIQRNLTKWQKEQRKKRTETLGQGSEERKERKRGRTSGESGTRRWRKEDEEKEEGRREKRKKRREKEDIHILVRGNTKIVGDLQNHCGQQGCLPILRGSLSTCTSSLLLLTVSCGSPRFLFFFFFYV